MEVLQAIEYGAYQIKLTGGYQFAVADDDDSRCFASLAEAKSWCDTQDKLEAAQAREKLSIAVVTGGLKGHVVTGVHAGHLSLMATPKLERYDSRSLYFDAPEVRALIAEKNRLRETAEAIDEYLKAFAISTASVGEYQSVRTHESAIANVKARVSKAQKLIASGVRKADSFTHAAR